MKAGLAGIGPEKEKIGRKVYKNINICYDIRRFADEPFAQAADSPTAHRVNGDWRTESNGSRRKTGG